MYFDFSVFVSRPTSLLVSKKDSVFSFMVFILSPNILISSAETNSSSVPFNSKPRCKQENNVWKGVDWMHMAQDRDHWQILGTQ